MSEDSKMLLSVAGLVVTGAVGLALVASCSSESARQAREAAADPGGAKPASRTVSTPAATPAFSTPAVETPALEPTPAPVVEQPFRVEPGENFVARGIETYDAREFDKAVAYFEAEIAERPDRAWSHYMLGLSLWKDGRADDAVAAMQRAEELDPGSIRTPINLSRIHNDRGEFDAALAAADRALEIDPVDATALFVRGRSLYNLGRRDEAVTTLEASLEADSDQPYALNLYGLTLLEAGSESAAVEPLRRAAELRPGVAFIHNNLGMALERSGHTAEALLAYQAAADADPAHERAARNAMRIEPLVSDAELGIVLAAIEGDPVEAEIEQSDGEPLDGSGETLPESR